MTKLKRTTYTVDMYKDMLVHVYNVKFCMGLISREQYRVSMHKIARFCA